MDSLRVGYMDYSTLGTGSQGPLTGCGSILEPGPPPGGLQPPASAGAAAKVDPSYKSKRYRDKLRTEVKALELLLPVDKSCLHRKLDSQTVFRLVIAYFRTKMFLVAGMKSAGSTASQDTALATDGTGATPGGQQSHDPHLPTPFSSGDLLQALDGFLIVVTADGTILYVSRNIVKSLGFSQVDLMHRCFYGIVHPDDHHELKMVLETSLRTNKSTPCSQEPPHGGATSQAVSFLVRIKCFNGTTTGYLKMHCTGRMRAFPGLIKSSRTSNQVVFAFCRPFSGVSTDPSADPKVAGFWSKHALDLSFKQMDNKVLEVIGYSLEELEGTSFYHLVHPEDLAVFSACHKTLIHTEEIQTMYFRIETKERKWMWLHTRGKVVFKNSKKYSIVFTHCPVREADSTYIQQEAISRRRYALRDMMTESLTPPHVYPPPDTNGLHHRKYNLRPTSGQTRTRPAAGYSMTSDLTADGQSIPGHMTECPSTWHAQTECHSPVFPSTNLPHKYLLKERVPLNEPPSKKMKPAGQTSLVTDAPSQPHGDSLSSRDVRRAFSGPDYIECHQTAPVSDSEFYQYSRLDGVVPRHYLMQLNSVGVSQPMSPTTTVVFQGHLTAIETTTPPRFIGSPCMRSRGSSRGGQFLPAGTAGNDLGRSDPYGGVPHSDGITSRSACGGVAGCPPTQYDQPTENISQLRWNHWVEEEDPPGQACCEDMKVPPTARGSSSCVYGSRPSCLYMESHHPAPWEATCQPPPTLRCKTELEAMDMRSCSDLPAIGSFLEYLKDISG